AKAKADLRLYAFDCGLIYSTHPEYFGLTLEQVGGNADLPVTCYAIRHPKGTLLFDAGLGDFRTGKPPEDTMGLINTVPHKLVPQLAKIGLTPDRIGMVAISHVHLDHVGNLALFPHARVLIQRAELNAVKEKVPLFTPPDAVARLEAPDVVPLDGDYD